MSKTLTIQLSDELEEKLLIQSKKLNLSLEELILQSLAKSIKLIDSYEDDPILPLLGTLRFENSDVGENHDHYLTENLQQELKIDIAAWDLLKTREDKTWSLVDSTSFIVMKKFDIQEALTTDHHFEQAGYIRLLK